MLGDNSASLNAGGTHPPASKYRCWRETAGAERGHRHLSGVGRAPAERCWKGGRRAGAGDALPAASLTETGSKAISRELGMKPAWRGRERCKIIKYASRRVSGLEACRITARRYMPTGGKWSGTGRSLASRAASVQPGFSATLTQTRSRRENGWGHGLGFAKQVIQIEIWPRGLRAFTMVR